ncbi:MAG: hypothetical protein COB67_07280 [SAR324 cluster bacterium]|uniref:Uncharacterized protein n=1 Tax=SAR324 cluster bacterium TaxID=2024889 RepID=A0A2A4T300_9DELT|nr:MAG: hypothetical protein COB67_07280 [SAR324 cluster bacterium]
MQLMTQTDPNELKAALREKNINPTIQRLAILECLRSTRSHPTVEEVKKMVEARLPMISTATVYNVLNNFEKNGLARAISVHRNSPQRFDGDLSPHHHLFEDSSQSLIDIPIESVSIDPKILEQYNISGVEIILKGVKRA